MTNVTFTDSSAADRPEHSKRKLYTINAILAMTVVATVYLFILQMYMYTQLDDCDRYNLEIGICSYGRFTQWWQAIGSTQRGLTMIVQALIVLTACYKFSTNTEYLKTHYNEIYGIATIENAFREGTRYGDNFKMILNGFSHNGEPRHVVARFDPITWFTFVDQTNGNILIRTNTIDLREHTPLGYDI